MKNVLFIILLCVITSCSTGPSPDKAAKNEVDVKAANEDDAKSAIQCVQQGPSGDKGVNTISAIMNGATLFKMTGKYIKPKGWAAVHMSAYKRWEVTFNLQANESNLEYKWYIEDGFIEPVNELAQSVSTRSELPKTINLPF